MLYGLLTKESRHLLLDAFPIMSSTNVASSRSINMYCDGYLTRTVKGSSFPVFSSVLSLRDEPLKACKRVIAHGNIVCSAAPPESSTATGNNFLLIFLSSLFHSFIPFNIVRHISELLSNKKISLPSQEEFLGAVFDWATKYLLMNSLFYVRLSNEFHPV